MKKKEKENEKIVSTGGHYSKEFKERFISEWDNKYRVLFKEVIPDRNKVKSIFLVPMSDLMLKEFPDEAMKHNGDDKDKLVKNLYHRYIKWIENPTKELVEKYKIINSNETITVSDAPVEMYVENGGFIEDSGLTYTSTDNNDMYNNIEVLTETKEDELKKYNITLQYAIPKFGIVHKWIKVAFDVIATDEIEAIAKAYECLWRKTGNVSNTRIREKSILVGGR